MKTVSGSVVSSKPISLPKAASILNGFVCAETGASTAISVFLRRASASFSELVQFHRELKAKRSKRKFKSIRYSETIGNVNLVDDADLGRSVDLKEDHSLRYSEISDGGGFYEEEGTGKSRKKKKKKRNKSDSEEQHGRMKKKRRHEEGN